MSGDNSFLGGSLLGQRWFLRMFDASSVSHIKWRLFRSFQNKYGHWELVILYNTDKSSTFFNWKARAILRLWVLNKRRCYFWHMPADWLQRQGETAADWLLLLSISSAPVQSGILIGPLPKFYDALDLWNTLVNGVGVHRTQSREAGLVLKYKHSTPRRETIDSNRHPSLKI